MNLIPKYTPSIMKFSFDKTKALLVAADMQKLFTLPTSPYGNDATPMIEPINQLMQIARNEDIPVVHSSYALKQDGSQTGLRTDWPQIEEGYFDPDSKWVQWDDRLQQKEEDYMLTRTRPGVFFDGHLVELMNQLGRSQVILLGLSTNYAISFSVHEGFSQDIPVFLVGDLTEMTAFEDRSQKSLLHKTLETWACQLISTEDLIANIKQKVSHQPEHFI